MGLVEKLRAELVDIVEWIDDGRHTLVWRFPRYHNQIKNGARLIVRPGQSAIFVHQGKIADVFAPGTHVLQTGNLPLLSTLAGWKHGFDSPFKAECYFVRTTQVTDLRWGTPSPVIIRDADFGPLRVRAFGIYALRASDPRRLLGELVGTDDAFETEEISELLRSIIHQSFAEQVATSEISVLDLARSYGELSEDLRTRVVARVGAEYGLDIPQLCIVNVSLPAEVERALDARTSMSVIGDLTRYQAYQIGQSLPIAAQNPAGGVAGAGIGLGLGAAVAGRMTSALGAPSPGLPPMTPPPPPLWHWVENGQPVGPLSSQDLRAAAQDGRLRSDALVWRAGMSDWIAASQVPELAALWMSSQSGSSQV
jgi:membrane protease subunit (stomatin/prohibitin family)